MKKCVSLGISFIFLGAVLADSANLLPTIFLVSSGALLLLGSKLCGTLVF